jgi:prepilin-type N-terminal cleavage/methylation domain-containing protein
MEHRRTTQSGFTLMELMVVIVIVAILAAVAVPLYINYVKDAQRTEAKGAIAAVISAQQVYYQAKGEFTDYNSADPPADATLKVDLSELTRSWTITAQPTGGEGTEAGFDVLAKNQDPDLNVCVKYRRNAAPDWDEGAACGAGGSGGDGDGEDDPPTP